MASNGPLRFAELEELSQIPKATLHRLINELSQERMVQYDTSAMTWSAGYRILEMSNRIWTRSDIRMLTRDQLLALNALSGETVQLAVLADTYVIVIDHVESTRSVRHYQTQCELADWPVLARGYGVKRDNVCLIGYRLCSRK